MTKSKASKKPTNAELQKQVKTLTAKVAKLTKQRDNAVSALGEFAKYDELAETLNVAQPNRCSNCGCVLLSDESGCPSCTFVDRSELPNPFEVDSLRMPWDK